MYDKYYEFRQDFSNGFSSNGLRERVFRQSQSHQNQHELVALDFGEKSQSRKNKKNHFYNKTNSSHNQQAHSLEVNDSNSNFHDVHNIIQQFDLEKPQNDQVSDINEVTTQYSNFDPNVSQNDHEINNDFEDYSHEIVDDSIFVQIGESEYIGEEILDEASGKYFPIDRSVQLVHLLGWWGTGFADNFAEKLKRHVFDLRVQEENLIREKIKKNELLVEEKYNFTPINLKEEDDDEEQLPQFDPVADQNTIFYPKASVPLKENDEFDGFISYRWNSGRSNLHMTLCAYFSVPILFFVSVVLFPVISLIVGYSVKRYSGDESKTYFLAHCAHGKCKYHYFAYFGVSLVLVLLFFGAQIFIKKKFFFDRYSLCQTSKQLCQIGLLRLRLSSVFSGTN